MMSRAYESKLRHEQSEATRIRILEAVARVLARGVTELTVPAVAEEAGVSVATVYRHFKTKEELVAGLRRHLFDMVGGEPAELVAGPYTSMAVALDDLPRVFALLGHAEPVLRSALASDIIDEYRREHRQERLDPIATLLRRERPDLPAADQRKLRDLIAVLVSNPGLRAFEVLTGASPEEAGETVAWAIRRLLGPGQRPTDSR